MSINFLLRVIATLMLCSFLPAGLIHAASVTLGWDANTESDLEGYKIYYKTGSAGPPYDGKGAYQGSSPIVVPLGDLSDKNNPKYTLDQLLEGQRYYIVITAYRVNEESEFSNEVQYYADTSGGTSEVCDDGIDNDKDGNIDCADSDCSGASNCDPPPPPPPATEGDCRDGIDNDKDGLTDCQDPDCEGEPGARGEICEHPESSCDDGYDNDGDGAVDCKDSNCVGVGVCSSDALLSASFDSNSAGFTYSDNTFRNTTNAKYASGNYASSGGYSGGGLHVALGGVDGVDITNGMSGGWKRSFDVNAAGTVNITLNYRLITERYDIDECSQVLVSIDGKLVGLGGKDYLERSCGITDSGWQQASLNVNLSKGRHTIVVGGWNNKKTAPREVAHIYFDDIIIASDGGGGSTPPGDTGGSGTDVFTYSDDTFRGTGHPKYASGNTENGLHVAIGGVDGVDITNGMSGGWSKKFTVNAAGNVTISFDYRLVTERYDSDECGQALVAIDGKLINFGGDDFLEEFCGPGDSGWRGESFDVNLSKGTHTITVGGWNNKKTGPGEVTHVYFDAIQIVE